MSAIRAATAGPRALRGDGQKTRVVGRDLFDAAARHRTEFVHAPFYGVRCVTFQTPVPTGSIHAKCGRATPQGEAQPLRAALYCRVSTADQSYGFRLIRPGCLAWATSGSLCPV